MIKPVILLSYLLMAACAGIGEIPVPQYQVDTEFEPFVRLFEKEANLRGIPIKITKLKMFFGKTEWLGEDVVAYCKMGLYIVVVSREYWLNSNKIYHELVVNHELGHCILELEHDNTSHWFGYFWGPNSIMNEYIIDGPTYIQNRDYYLNQLFLFAN